MTDAIKGQVYESSVSDDGKLATFTFKTDGDPISIDIPSEQLPYLLILASQAGGRSEAIQKANPTTTRYIIETAKWRVFLHPDGQNIVQQFHLPQGMVIQLRSPKALIPAMVKELTALQGAPPISTIKN